METAVEHWYANGGSGGGGGSGSGGDAKKAEAFFLEYKGALQAC